MAMCQLTRDYSDPEPIYINPLLVLYVEPSGDTGSAVAVAAPKDDGVMRIFVTEDPATVVNRLDMHMPRMA